MSFFFIYSFIVCSSYTSAFLGMSVKMLSIAKLHVFMKDSFMIGVSNVRLRGQNWPGEDSNLAHWMVLETVKENITFNMFYRFSYRQRPLP